MGDLTKAVNRFCQACHVFTALLVETGWGRLSSECKDNTGILSSIQDHILAKFVYMRLLQSHMLYVSPDTADTAQKHYCAKYSVAYLCCPELSYSLRCWILCLEHTASRQLNADRAMLGDFMFLSYLASFWIGECRASYRLDVTIEITEWGTKTYIGKFSQSQ